MSKQVTWSVILFGWVLMMSIVWNLFVPRGLSVGTFVLLCLAPPVLVLAARVILDSQAPSQSVRQIRATLDSEERARTDTPASR